MVCGRFVEVRYTLNSCETSTAGGSETFKKTSVKTKVTSCGHATPFETASANAFPMGPTKLETLGVSGVAPA